LAQQENAQARCPQWVESGRLPVCRKLRRYFVKSEAIDSLTLFHR